MAFVPVRTEVSAGSGRTESQVNAQIDAKLAMLDQKQEFDLSLISFGDTGVITPTIDASRVYDWIAATDVDHSYGTIQANAAGDVIGLHQDGSAPWVASIASATDIQFESQSADAQVIQIEVRAR